MTRRPRPQPTDYLLRRLQRLARIRLQHQNELNALGLKILDRGIWSTFRDCCELGREEDASRVMHGLMVELARGGA